MKTGRLLIEVLVVMVFASPLAQAAKGPVTKPKPARELAEAEKKKEATTKRRLKSVEERYALQRQEQRLRAENEIDLFEKAEKKTWTDRAVTTDWLFDSFGYLPTNSYTQLDNGRWVLDDLMAKSEKRIEDKKEAVQTRLKRILAEIEYEKNVQVNAILSRAKKPVRTQGKKPKLGMVTGILFGEKPVALMNGRFIRPGDKIQDVNVVNIFPHEVEFEKGQTRWRQRVGRPAAGHWK